MTTRKTHVTPGRVMKMQARAGIVVAGLFLLFGLALGLVVYRETPRSETGLSLLLLGFLLIWSAGCVTLIVFYGRLLRRHSRPDDDSLVELCESGLERSATAGSSFDSRLRKLEQLKNEGLISEQEYREKRAGMMAEKW